MNLAAGQYLPFSVEYFKRYHKPIVQLFIELKRIYAVLKWELRPHHKTQIMYILFIHCAFSIVRNA